MVRDSACHCCKENVKGGDQTAAESISSLEHVAKGNARMRMHSCQQLARPELIILMEVKCVTVVMLAVYEAFCCFQ